jgi:16S rRNA (guanine966-N2)-methyltransferase
MRITGGTHRGRNLPTKVLDGVRPTSSRVREALFNILGNRLEGSSVFDATGGSGILALEAASRGGGPVLIQDRDRRAVRRLRLCVEALQLQERVSVRCADSLHPAADAEAFDLVLADPPYAQELEPWVGALAGRARECLVLEHDAKKPAPAPPEGFELNSRRYGGTALSFYRRR